MSFISLGNIICPGSLGMISACAELVSVPFMVLKFCSVLAPLYENSTKVIQIFEIENKNRVFIPVLVFYGALF